MNRSADTIAVLMYHGLHRGDDGVGIHDPVYSLTPEMFERHLDCIARSGRRPVTDSDLAGGVPDGIMITFDDGDRSNHRRALPVLERRAVPATFFITTNWIGRPEYMDEAMIRQLHACGMSIGSHGCSHRYLSGLDDDALQAELADSRSRLEDIIGAPVRCVSLPGGRGGSRAVNAAHRIGYERVYGSRLGTYDGTQLLIPRIPIDSGTSAEDLAALLNHGMTWWTRRARQWALDAAKSAMGDPLYDRVRSVILRS